MQLHLLSREIFLIVIALSNLATAVELLLSAALAVTDDAENNAASKAVASKLIRAFLDFIIQHLFTHSAYWLISINSYPTLSIISICILFTSQQTILYLKSYIKWGYFPGNIFPYKKSGTNVSLLHITQPNQCCEAPETVSGAVSSSGSDSSC